MVNWALLALMFARFPDATRGERQPEKKARHLPGFEVDSGAQLAAAADRDGLHSGLCLAAIRGTADHAAWLPCADDPLVLRPKV